MWAQLSHYYGLKPWEVDDLTMSQIDFYLDNVPMLEYRRAYPIAAMMAHAANLQGGKPRKKPKKDYAHTAYRPEEFLSWFARFEDYLEMSGFTDETLGIDEETAKLVVQLNTTKTDGSRGSRLEPWMLAAMPWDEVVKAGS